MLILTTMNRYIPHITKEEIAALSTVATFNGDIILIDSLEKVDSAVEAMYKDGVWGFDTETRPSFVKNEQNEVSLLQFSTLEKAYLFRLNKIGFPAALRSFIEDEAILKVGLSLQDDFRAMRRREKVIPRGFIELQKITSAFGIEDLSLRSVYAILFAERMSKQARLTNWDMEILPDKAIQYAALDAYACIRIFNELHSQPLPSLSDFGRVYWTS